MKSAERFEVPLAERITAIRARKAEERARGRVKAEGRARHPMTRSGDARAATRTV